MVLADLDKLVKTGGVISRDRPEIPYRVFTQRFTEDVGHVYTLGNLLRW